MGDAGYARGFNAAVNNRHVTFAGVGALGDSYHLGDWISQVSLWVSVGTYIFIYLLYVYVNNRHGV